MKPVVVALIASLAALASDTSLELRGQVTGLAPIKRLHVQLFGVEQPFTGTAEIDKTGQFRFRDLEPGNYTLALVRPGLGEIRRTIVVTPGLADARGVVNAEVPYSSSEAASMETDKVSLAALSVSKEAHEKYERAQERRARRDVAGTVALLKEAVALAPQFATAWNALGVLAFQTGDVAGAEAYYRRGVEADAHAFEPLVNLGAMLLRARRGAEALVYNERAVSERSHDAGALVQLGMNLVQLQRYDEAERPLRAAKAIDPAHHMLPQLFLAEIYQKRGERAKAVAELEELLELRPDEQRLKPVLQRLHEEDRLKPVLQGLQKAD